MARVTRCGWCAIAVMDLFQHRPPTLDRPRSPCSTRDLEQSSNTFRGMLRWSRQARLSGGRAGAFTAVLTTADRSHTTAGNPIASPSFCAWPRPSRTRSASDCLDGRGEAQTLGSRVADTRPRRTVGCLRCGGLDRLDRRWSGPFVASVVSRRLLAQPPQPPVVEELALASVSKRRKSWLGLHHRSSSLSRCPHGRLPAHAALSRQARPAMVAFQPNATTEGPQPDRRRYPDETKEFSC